MRDKTRLGSKKFGAVILTAAGALFSASFSSVTGTSPPLDEAPYRIDYHGWITVDAQVNGTGPHDFILDTGATITAVFANLAAQSQLAPAARPPIRILGLTGARELTAYTIGDITISNTRLTDHVGVILPDWAPPNTPPQGVLGLDFLTQYKTVLSAKEKKLKIYASNVTPDHPMRGWKTTPLKPLTIDGEGKPLYQTYVRIRNSRIPCVVDLGASGTIFNQAAYRSMTGNVIINGTWKNGLIAGSDIHDVFDTEDRAIALRVKRMRIGGAAWRKQTVIVYDAQIFEEFGYKNKPFCLIGADLFVDRSLMLDFKGETLHISPGRRR